jgi:peptide/nickel transport system permease protein
LLCVYAGAAPAVAIAVIVFPRVFRYARNVVGAARRATHVLAAHALGMRRWRVLAYHVAAPVVPDLLALAGVSVSMAVGATIPVEALSDSPGVGQLLWQAALSRDVPVLVNLTLLITAVTAGANLLADTARAAREYGS